MGIATPPPSGGQRAQKLPLMTIYMDSASGKLGIDQHSRDIHPPKVLLQLLDGMIDRYEAVLGQSVVIASEDDGLIRQ